MKLQISMVLDCENDTVNIVQYSENDSIKKQVTLDKTIFSENFDIEPHDLFVINGITKTLTNEGFNDTLLVA